MGISDWLYNAVTGNLSADQVAQAVATAQTDVAKAAAGRDPAVVVQLQQQAAKDVNDALATFKMPGEAGTEVGALPVQSGLRIPGVGNVTPETLKSALGIGWKTLLIVGGLGLLVVALPYIAAPLGRAFGATRKGIRVARA